jgi:fumarate hydratase class II
MNVNEVIANRCAQIAGQPLGSKTPVHSNDHFNMSQSCNDSFPIVMNVGVRFERLLREPSLVEQAPAADAG